MRYVLILLLIITGFNWAQSKFHYFPLGVGNKWYFSAPLYSRNHRQILTVSKDTLLDDGYQYAKIISAMISTNSQYVEYTDGFLYLRNAGGKIIQYSGKKNFDFNMQIGDTTLTLNDNKSVLDSVVEDQVFGRKLSTYYLAITKYDYYTYTDSIGFNTWIADTWYDGLFDQLLIGCEIDGKKYGETITGIERKQEMPTDYSLRQNFPNPFNPKTTIIYSIPDQSYVELKVYDMMGREISTLVSKEQSSGEYKLLFDGSGLPSGIYIYKIKAGEYSASKKFMILK